MVKFFWLILGTVFFATNVYATPINFDKYFKVDMQMEIPDIETYVEKLTNTYKLYDRGYTSRYSMGLMFKKEFSRVIKFYGSSEGRIKSDYEDDVLEMISLLPKEMYPYIGPLLHEVPGMSEKILNLPGIKETKNKFPEDIAERYKDIENIEYLSPALYVLLMPSMWEKKKPKDKDAPEKVRVHKPYVSTELPDYLKEKIGVPVKVAEPKKGRAEKKASLAQKLNLRTINPTLTSPLTGKDVEAFIETIDLIMEWGTENDYHNYGQLINGEAILDIWEAEQQTALPVNDLKDAVNPCQRLVLKTRFSDQYGEFSRIVAQKGFSAEEWAYTCDKTIKAFRMADANMSIAKAVQAHRRGYYNQYFDKLPKRWRNEMYAMNAAIVKMYTALKEDVDAVRPYKDVLTEKFNKIHGIMLTAPIIY